MILIQAEVCFPALFDALAVVILEAAEASGKDVERSTELQKEGECPKPLSCISM